MYPQYRALRRRGDGPHRSVAPTRAGPRLMDFVEVAPAHEVDLELVAAFERLIPQLSRSSPPPTADELAEIVTSPATTLFVAQIDGLVVGTLTLVMFRIPTGV